MPEVAAKRPALAGLLAALALLAPAVAPTLAWAKPPVWTVYGPGATITLFGSVHVLPQDLDWRPEALTAALAHADELWFETPLDPADLLDAQRLALAKGMLPQGQTLSAALSPAGRARLKRVEEQLRLPAPQMERLQPWLAEVTLSDAEYARDGASPDQGVERQLASAAPQARRMAFETIAQQIDMFAGASRKAQVASLEDTLKEVEEDPGQSRRLIQAWEAGDLKAIDEEGLQALRRSSPEIFKALLTDRNAAWIRILTPRLQAQPAPGSQTSGNQTSGAQPVRMVVVVGVGHLVGPGGLPQILRRRGFRVDGPTE
jgi:uncharacterized protein YbaP (TraB family)